MAETTSRVLELLSLLQAHRQWAGPELADRLGVTERTLRRDVERIRELGYRVDAVRGPAGGYRLEAGSRLPPLLLSDDEAVTMAIGLRVAATQGLVDGETTTQTALAKFEQVLPSGLRERVAAIASHLESATPRAAPVAGDLLGQLALACRDSERIRFHYAAADGTESDRSAEPHALVAANRNWFLVCWDVQRVEWRSFRVDRLSRLVGTRLRFERRDIPGGSAAAYVATTLSSLRTRYHAEVILDAPIEAVRGALRRWANDATSIDQRRTRWPIEAESPEHLVSVLAWIPAGIEYRVHADERVLDLLRDSGRRALAAAGIATG